MAAGRVLTILNSDDLYAPDRLGRCVAALDAGHELVVTGVACIDRQGRPDQSPSAHRLAALPASIAAFPTASAAFLGVNRAVSTGNLLFTRDLHRRVGGFRDMPYCHDWDFVLGAMLETEPRLVDGALYRYRLHDANSFRELAPWPAWKGSDASAVSSSGWPAAGSPTRSCGRWPPRRSPGATCCAPSTRPWPASPQPSGAAAGRAAWRRRPPAPNGRRSSSTIWASGWIRRAKPC